jgi:anti-sigma factor RsiW
MRSDFKMSTIDEDARLVAFIDGELDEGARAELEARLAIDPILHERLMRLQEGRRPFAAAFDALLDDAPVQRLEAALASYIQRGERRPTSIRASLRLQAGRLGVAAAVIVFCAGIVVGRYGPSWSSRSPDIVTPTGDDDWRQAVAEYMTLYTPDTFATEPESQERELTALGAKIGLSLTAERVALANLQFKGGQIFGFHGAPLGQLGYVDPATGPVLFCIIRDSEPDAAMKAESRGEFAVASWARSGRGYMLIGRLPINQVAQLADSLEKRF